MMEFKCPVCQAVYRIADEKFKKPVARSVCKGCGTVLTIDKDSGRVTSTPEGPALKSPPDKNKMPVPHPFALSSSRRSVKEKKDFLAGGIFVLVLAALVLTVGLAAVRFTTGFGIFSGQPAKKAGAEISPGKPANKTVARQEPKTPASQLKPASRQQGNAAVDVNQLLQEGYRQYEANRMDEALSSFNRALKTDAVNAQAYFWRGRTYIRQGNYDNALTDFLKALELKPNYSQACDNLGWLYMKRGEFDTSLRYLNQSIALDPNNGWAYYNRGRIFFKNGERQRALKDAEKACSLGYKAACKVYERYRNAAEE